MEVRNYKLTLAFGDGKVSPESVDEILSRLYKVCENSNVAISIESLKEPLKSNYPDLNKFLQDHKDSPCGPFTTWCMTQANKD